MIRNVVFWQHIMARPFMPLKWVYLCGIICQIKVWTNTAWSCTHQSIVCFSYILHVQLLCMAPIEYHEDEGSSEPLWVQFCSQFRGSARSLLSWLSFRLSSINLIHASKPASETFAGSAPPQCCPDWVYRASRQWCGYLSHDKSPVDWLSNNWWRLSDNNYIVVHLLATLKK